MRRARSCFCQSGLAAFLLLSTPCYSQHFGFFSKETVTLHRKLPSVFLLTGTQVSVKVISTAPNTTALGAQLGPMIETLLQQNDHRVSVENVKPQTLITCTISGYVPPAIVKSTSPPIVTKKGTTPGQDSYRVTGDLMVSYSARDDKSKRTLDANVLESKINTTYDGSGNKQAGSFGEVFGNLKHLRGGSKEMPTTTTDVDQLMVRQIAWDVTRRVVNTDETLQVLLPKGKLEKAAKFAEAGAWSRMLEEAESTAAFAKPEEESYRLYDIGLAYEGMGYGAPDPKQALNLFEQASINYGKALDTNPNDKTLREPPTRIQEALVLLRTIEERKKGQPVDELKAQVPAAVPVSSASEAKTSEQRGAPAAAAADEDTLTNQGIIELKKSGMDDANLLANIHDAKRVKFDLTIGGQKELMQAGISNGVLTAMRQRAKGTRVSDAPVAKSKGPVQP